MFRKNSKEEEKREGCVLENNSVIVITVWYYKEKQKAKIGNYNNAHSKAQKRINGNNRKGIIW